MMETFHYDNKIVRNFAIATVTWGIIGFLVGLIVALKLIFPEFLGGIAELSYGRLRPLHTNAVIFAFAGNAIFLGIYYSLPRLLKASMWSAKLSALNFWGWQAIILGAVVTLPLGITTSKEYAELEWFMDIAIALVWVIFGLNMLATIFTRREKHIYVAIWFYIATFVTVAVLHIVNSLAIPATFLKSYPVFAGVQDALVQWVRAQRSGVLPHHAVPRHHVLFHSESGEPSGLQLQTVDRALLVADLYLHLGGSAPLAVHVAALLGAIAGNRVQHHADRTELGWDDQRLAHLAWRVRPRS
jgi:hypothetical protein